MAGPVNRQMPAAPAAKSGQRRAGRHRVVRISGRAVRVRPVPPPRPLIGVPAGPARLNARADHRLPGPLPGDPYPLAGFPEALASVWAGEGIKIQAAPGN